MLKLTHFPSPVQSPQGLAWDGAALWVTSAATARLYRLALPKLTLETEVSPPYEPLGITWTGAELRLVLAPNIEEPDELDHRFVYSFRPDVGFSECFVCPDFSGSHLAYAGGSLYVSQAWDKHIVKVDDAGKPLRTIALERRPVGMTIVDGNVYVATVNDAWGDGLFQRLPLDPEQGAIETLQRLAFKPRGVAFDGKRFWIGDREGHALVSLA